MRVLVAGGAGFLGSHLCERLLADGHEVVCVDNLITGRDDHVKMFLKTRAFTFVRHNLSEPLYVDGPIDAVMNLASPASPGDYLTHPIPTLKVGALGTFHTLGMAKDKGAKYFLASTSEVYGDPQVHPQPEGYWGHVNPIGPRGVYDEAKRYAEAMTMAYHRFHGVDTRIARIFNSILADEQVLYDDGTTLRRERVGDLAGRVGHSADLREYTVPAFDAAGRISPHRATALVGHPFGGRCFEISLRYGRSIRVTEDHSVFVERPEGPVALPASQIRPGDLVAVAARVRVPERDRLHVDMCEVWDRAGRDDMELSVVAPGIGEMVWRRRYEIFDLLARLGYGARSDRWRSVIWGRIARDRAYDQAPLGILRRLGEPIPDGARVRLRTAGHAARLPRTIPLTDEMLWFLGLYVAEGCRYEQSGKSAFISVSCEADLLDRAQKILERDLGVLVVRAPYVFGRAGSLTVHSKLLLDLFDYLGFSSGPKRIPGWILGLPLSRLKWFLEGYREGDGVHSGQKLEEGLRHEFSTVSEVLKDDLIVALTRFGIVPSVGRYETTNKPRTGDRRYPFWRLTVCNVSPWSPLEWDGGVEQKLNARRFGDLLWARVRSIEEVTPTELVYDFCVPGAENFWAGSGVMAHNTFGPRMRPNDGRAVANFITQALAGKNITVHGDGSQTRSFCYVTDLIDGFVRLLGSGYNAPVNLGNPDEYTVLQLARTIIELTGSSSEIVYEPRPVDDPNVRRPDISLARELLDWEPRVPLREGLIRTIEYFRSL